MWLRNVCVYDGGCWSAGWTESCRESCFAEVILFSSQTVWCFSDMGLNEEVCLISPSSIGSINRQLVLIKLIIHQYSNLLLYTVCSTEYTLYYIHFVPFHWFNYFLRMTLMVLCFLSFLLAVYEVLCRYMYVSAVSHYGSFFVYLFLACSWSFLFACICVYIVFSQPF